MKLLKIHFWVMLILFILVVGSIGVDEFYDATPKGVANSFFSIAGLILYFGYIYRKRYLSKEIWRPFVIVYFLWELFCYFSYENGFGYNVYIFISLIPKYFAVAMYSLYMGSFHLPENESFEELEHSIFSKVLFKLVVSVSIVINLFVVVVSIFA
jgi:hypothetical protein